MTMVWVLMENQSWDGPSEIKGVVSSEAIADTWIAEQDSIWPKRIATIRYSEACPIMDYKP